MDYITADTTDGKILSKVEVAKAALLRKVEESQTSEYLLGEKLVEAALAVHTAETLASAQLRYREVCKNNPARRTAFLFEVATQSDDTWSGRGNDTRRAAQDRVREWAKDQHREVLFEERNEG